jgi:electron transport complex protein RnfG
MSETPPRKGGYIGQAWLVILLALVYGGALAGVQTKLGPMIAENKRNETYREIPALVGLGELSDAEKTKVAIEELTVEGPDGKSQRVYRASFDGALQGWVLPAGGPGFADRIELLIGLDPEVSTITGLFVLDQKETPGLGNFIADEDFRNQFAGKSTLEPLLVVKSSPAADNEILALTGATISSESVATIVNDAIAHWKEPIRQLGSAPAAPPDAAPQ